MSDSKTPRISLPGGRFFDGDALLAAAESATPHARNTAVHLLNLYKAMTIRQGFLHKLTEEQIWRCTIIKNSEDWAGVSGRFMADVDLYKVFSLDTESLAPTSGPRHTRHAIPAPNRRLYLIASTVSGFTVLFDLEELNGGLPVGNKDLLSLVPPPFAVGWPTRKSSSSAATFWRTSSLPRPGPPPSSTPAGSGTNSLMPPPSPDLEHREAS